eukprot:Em0014g221a
MLLRTREQCFQANGIGDEGKRRAVLLSVCGGSVYQLIRNLVVLGKPSDKSFSELVTLVRFVPRPTMTALRLLEDMLRDRLVCGIRDVRSSSDDDASDAKIEVMTTDASDPKNNDVSEVDDNDDVSEKVSGDDASTDTSKTA